MMHSLESVREEDEAPSTSISSSSSSALHGAAQQRAHARQHSRIHERNLSAFFPRPGQVAQGYGDTYVDPHAAARSNHPLGSPSVADIPSAPSSASSASQDPFVVSPPKPRRGHHHRHSVSHNLFPFLDPAAGAPPPPPPPGKASSPSARPPDDAQLPALSSPFRTRFAHLPLPLRFLLFATTALPLPSRALLALALAQVALGATLWVQGQAGESLAVTGLGYLVVFDGVGALSSVLLEGEGALERTLGALGSSRDLSIRRPYGPARLVTLSHFSQAVYLLFSAVYVCKESVEHVLLLHGPHDAEGAHGAGHGGVGHGEGLAVLGLGEGHGDSIALPTRALFLSAACAVALAVCARNHAGLSHALSRRSGASPKSSSSSAAAAQLAMGPPKFLTALVNPFTATVLLFSGGLLGAAVVLPPAQLAPLDKVVALLESAAMFYVAQPAASATGRVLLQTSPGAGSAAVRAVEGLVQELEALPAVTSVDPPHIWQLSSTSPSSSLSSSPAPAGPTLIATLHLHAHPHATDAERLAVSQHVRERVRRANERLRERGGSGAGEGGIEVCVQVKRG